MAVSVDNRSLPRSVIAMTRSADDRSLPRSVIAAAIVVGIALRVWLVNTAAGRLDGDEAVVGLMATSILRGQHPVFFNYQNYGGTQEVYLVAVLFKLFGTNVLLLRLVSIGLQAIGCVLTWRIGRRLIGERAAQLAGLSFWVFPGALLWWGTKAGCFYGFTLVCGLLVMLFAIRIAEDPTFGDALVLGLAAGLGVWASPQILFFFVPTAIWFVAHRWRWMRDEPVEVLRLSGAAVAAAIVGAFPWLLWNLHHGWASLSRSPSQETYGQTLRTFFRYSFPAAFGLRQPFTFQWVLPFGIALYVVLAVALVWTIVRWPAAALLSVFVIAYPFLFGVTPQSGTNPLEPRYLYYLAPMVLLLLAVPLRRVAVPALVVFAISSAATVSFIGSEPVTYQHFADDQVRGQDIGPIIQALRQHHETVAYAPFRWAYRISFESHEHILATPLETLLVRDRDIASKVRSSPEPAAFVVPRGSNTDRVLQRAVADGTVRVTRTVGNDFVVYFPEKKVLPEQVHLLSAWGLG